MTEMDVKREIRRAVDTGKIEFGLNKTQKGTVRGKGQMVILSENMHSASAERLRHYAGLAGIPVYAFEGTGLELGKVCGKPFVVSALIVHDEGKSKVLELVKESAGTEKPARMQKRGRAKK